MVSSLSSASVSTLPAFSQLDLAPALLKAVHDEGYTVPTPIQAKAIPPALAGRDLLGCAQTGTGKTAAFALPILQKLAAGQRAVRGRGRVAPRALILAPTRELATQIAQSFATYGRHAGLAHAVVYGGVSEFHQIKAIERGVDILVATPGRLIDLLDRTLVDLAAIEVLVLDEADRMLDMGFIRPIRKIAGAVPSRRQTMLFSATMPKEIRALAASLLSDPVEIAVARVASAAPLIEQSVLFVPKNAKQSLLEHLLRETGVERSVVFTRTKHGADRVTRRLAKVGIAADAIHGNKTQNRRDRALAAFKAGTVRVLVATDVAARGLDIDGITHVFNFDLPNEPEAYVHRIGRTGRAGATGLAIAFCDSEERELLRDIERLIGKSVPVQALPKDLVIEVQEPSDRADRGERGERSRGQRQGSRGSSSSSSRGGSASGGSRGRSGRAPQGKPERPTQRSSGQKSAAGAAQPRGSIGSGAGIDLAAIYAPPGLRAFGSAGRGRGRGR